MSRYVITSDDLTYTVSPLEPPPAADRHCAILRAALTDETTGREPRATVKATLTAPLVGRLGVRVVEPGFVVVSGKVRPAFSPTLATSGEIDILLQAQGFTDRILAVPFACALRTLTAAASNLVLTLNSNANLTPGQRLLVSTPDGARVEFRTLQVLGPGLNQVTLATALSSPYPVGGFVQPLPPDLAVALHRTATIITGRILKNGLGAPTPLANADVHISKLWRQIPTSLVTPTPEPPVPGLPPPPPPWSPPVAAIRPPCYATLSTNAKVEIEDRPIDGTMTPKTLLDATGRGATTLRVSDALAMALGDVLSIDADDDGRREILEVAKISLSGGPGDWAALTLSQPLALTHARGRIIRRLGAPVGATPIALNYEAARNDSAILFDTTSVTGPHQIRIVDPGPPIVRSYHRLDVYATKSDADGYYRLPALTRAGRIEIYAKDSGSAATNSIEFVPEYADPENKVDIVVS